MIKGRSKQGDRGFKKRTESKETQKEELRRGKLLKLKKKCRNAQKNETIP